MDLIDDVSNKGSEELSQEQPRDVSSPVQSKGVETDGKKDVKRSDVWAHFEKVGDDLYKCKNCKGDYPNKKGWGTKNLINHLDRCLKVKDTQDPNQMKFTVEVKDRSKLSPKDQEDADLLLLKIIVEDERPFRMPQTDAFKDFCRKLNPLYKVPCYNTIVKKLDLEYGKMRIELDKLISSLPALALTMDGWKSNTSDSYASLEAHYWDFSKNQKCTRTWNVFLIQDVHCTGETLQALLREIFGKIGWDSAKIDSIITTTVSDGGGNICKAFKLMNLRNIHCGPHVINVVCQKGIEGCPDLYTRSKKFVAWINESSVAWMTLKKHQGNENVAKQLDDVIYVLIQEVSTRWNSFFYLVDRLLLLEDCILKTITELNPSSKLTPEDFKAMKDLSNLLEPFEKATRLLSTDRNSTVQYLIPTMINLKNQTTSLIITFSEVEECRKKLLYELDVELNCYLGNNQLLIATICDPRLKKATFLGTSVRDRAYQLIRDTLSRMKPPKETVEIPTVVNKKEKFDSFIEQFFIHCNTTDQNSDELTRYLADEVYPLEDATDYWIQNSKKFPNLSQIALTHLSIPSSSASSERNNSQMGRTVTKLRNRLDPTTVIQLNIMKGNLDLW